MDNSVGVTATKGNLKGGAGMNPGKGGGRGDVGREESGRELQRCASTVL